MEITCPICGQAYEVEGEIDGKTVKCSACGNAFKVQIVALASGKPPRASGCRKWGCIVLIAVFVAFAALLGTFSPQTSPSSTPNPVLEERLSYLVEIDGLAWSLIRNDVYMSWRGDSLPPDYKVIANAAAVNGSLALVDSGEVPTRCSVFVIPEQHKPGDVSKCFYIANARKGKLEK